MLSKPPFPVSPEELTEEVLSESLGKKVDSFSYTRIGSDRGMLGVVLLLDISYSDGSKAVSYTHLTLPTIYSV